MSERILAASPEVRLRLASMVDDPSPRVRYRLAFTLGDLPGPTATAPLAAIARRDAGDRWVELAVASSAAGRAGDLFAQLASTAGWRSTDPARALLARLAELAGRGDRKDQVAAVLRAIEACPSGETELVRSALAGLGKGLEAAGSPLRKELTTGDRAAVLAGLVAEARAVASREDVAEERRMEAIQSLSLSTFDQIGELLIALLDGRQPPGVQVAALRTLSRYRDEEVAEAIVDAWATFSPRVRSEAIEVMFARPERVVTLLAAVEDALIEVAQIDPARRSLLRRHAKPEIAERAADLFRETESDRKEVVEKHLPLLEKEGDAARGKEVFKKVCSACHRLEGIGYDLGLPLAAIKNRGPETILISLLDPNREVNPQYLGYVVVTRKGDLITGMITAETATSITLQRGEGQSDTVLRRDIETLESSGVSVMPEGLETEVGEDAIPDLIEYLMQVSG